MFSTIRDFTINPNDTIIKALIKINDNRKGFLVVVDELDRVIGTLTDGDIRRAFIKGKMLNNSVEESYNKNFQYIGIESNVEDTIDIFKENKIDFIPIIDKEDRLLNIITRKQLHALMLLNIRADLGYDFNSIDESITDYEIYRRPWGFFKTTVMNTYFQSKIISINPKAQLSLQSHKKREEYWIITHGNGTVQIDQSNMSVSKGSMIFIPKGAKHRVRNNDKNEVLLITEVQLGEYFGEDDIIRYEDIYGRTERVAEEGQAKLETTENEMHCDTDRQTLKSIPEIKMLLTDCDGCLTDGGMYYSEYGDELKKFNTRDGKAFELLRKRGIVTGIITSEKVALNRRRAEKLKLDILEEGCREKAEAIEKYCKKFGIGMENVCYIGDDVNDLEAIKSVGYSCCPADAVSIIKNSVDYISGCKGGDGVVRDVVRKINIEI